MNIFFNAFNPHNWPPAESPFWFLVLFWLGCMVGSFLNVCIYRMPLDLSVVSPPSHCPHCKYSIPFYLNIPLLTWLSLKGRCKNCGAPISSRYFIVELFTGLTFLGCWLYMGAHSPALALVYCLFLSGLIVATFIDFEHFIIPDEITLGGAVAGFIVSFLLPSLHGVRTNSQGMVQSAIGIVAGAGIVYAVLRAGKLLFGKYALDLDPESRVMFTEESIVLPPKQVNLSPRSQPGGCLAFKAGKVELIDRCCTDVDVVVSDSQITLKSGSGVETVERAGAVHFEAIFDRLLSAGELAGVTGVRRRPLQVLADWFRSVGRSLFRRRGGKIHRGDWLVFNEAGIWIRRDEMRFEDGEIFYRDNDAISFHAREIKMQFGSWRDVPVSLTPGELTVGSDKFNPAAVARMEVVTDHMILPREAMGLGDVKFMAAIGAFLGWQAVVFTLVVASMIGAVYGAVMVALRRQDWSGRLYFGPFLALAATLWIFAGVQLVNGYLYYSQLFLNKLIGH